eukprot:GEMP01077564.1.p1 GENE.GEMP01077564.1~~GEMP01077564.1.p1  ORF type:complete len:153 (+),score=30.66 GEMP01077564.1:138-596(+)
MPVNSTHRQSIDPFRAQKAHRRMSHPHSAEVHTSGKAPHATRMDLATDVADDSDCSLTISEISQQSMTISATSRQANSLRTIRIGSESTLFDESDVSPMMRGESALLKLVKYRLRPERVEEPKAHKEAAAKGASGWSGVLDFLGLQCVGYRR